MNLWPAAHAGVEAVLGGNDDVAVALTPNPNR